MKEQICFILGVLFGCIVTLALTRPDAQVVMAAKYVNTRQYVFFDDGVWKIERVDGSKRHVHVINASTNAFAIQLKQP